MPERAPKGARVTRADRYRQAKALRDRGLYLREIGEQMGLSVQYVHNLLKDPDGSKMAGRRKAAEERHRKACVDCGDLLGPGSAWRKARRCRPCHVKRVGESREELLAFVEWMWNEGCTLDEMAAELGWSSRPGPLVDALRKAGRIGYRYKAYEQRAA